MTPANEVRFENLGVEAEVFVGSRNLPTVINSYRNFFEVRQPAELTSQTKFGPLLPCTLLAYLSIVKLLLDPSDYLRRQIAHQL